MRGPKGELVPLEVVKPQHRLQDEAVRALFVKARAAAEQLAAFKAGAFEDIDALLRLLDEQYKAKVGGEKGNISLFSYDALQRIQVQVSDIIKFGPELQTAKALLEECTADWLEGSRAELRVLVMGAFKTDKEGEVSPGALLGLRRYEISDERWKRAMEAISDSIQVIGTKRYIRFSFRDGPKAPWQNVSLDIATA